MCICIQLCVMYLYFLALKINSAHFSQCSSTFAACSNIHTYIYIYVYGICRVSLLLLFVVALIDGYCLYLQLFDFFLYFSLGFCGHTYFHIYVSMFLSSQHAAMFSKIVTKIIKA